MNINATKTINALPRSDIFFALGAQDGEMREIEKVLSKFGFEYAYASTSGLRSDSSQAYQSQGVCSISSDGRVRSAVPPPNKAIAFVECTIPLRIPDARIDHHNPGDPGYEAPPARYLEGSSLGQVLALLGEKATDDQRLMAAADHCLTAAYQGLCPGVDPGELLFSRAAWQALMTRRTLSETMSSIIMAGAKVRRRYDERLGASFFSDPTRSPKDLPEGAAYVGIPVIYRSLMPGGTMKEMIKGACPARIEAFMREHQAKGRRTYGNPFRGYAGAYFD